MTTEEANQPNHPNGDPVCPFCGTFCTVGFDCHCGAKAVNSAVWFTGKPLMRDATLNDYELMLMACAKTLGKRLREMVRKQRPASNQK